MSEPVLPEDYLGVLDDLKQRIEAFFQESRLKWKLCIPFSEGRIVTELHQTAVIQSTEYGAQGTILNVLLPASEAEAYMKYRIEE